MENVGPCGNASYPQFYLVTGILLPEIALIGIIRRHHITWYHNVADAYPGPLLPQSFLPIRSLFPLGLFCIGSQCLYLVSQQMIVREFDEDLDVNFQFSPGYTVATYCGLKTWLPPSLDFTILLLNKFTNMPFRAKSPQLLVSLRFFNPRDDAFCIV